MYFDKESISEKAMFQLKMSQLGPLSSVSAVSCSRTKKLFAPLIDDLISDMVMYC